MSDPIPLSVFLKNAQFDRHPFRALKAEELEIEELKKTLVGEDQVEGLDTPELSTILLARSGEGKTARRRWLEDKLDPRKSPSDLADKLIVASYHDFELAHRQYASGSTGPWLHRRGILAAIAKGWLQFVAANPQSFLNRPRAEQIWWWIFWERYALPEAPGLHRWPKDFPPELIENNKRLLPLTQRLFRSTSSLAEVIQVLLERSQPLGVQRILISVDNLEAEHTATGSPELLNALLNVPSLFGLPQLTWKFFLDSRYQPQVYSSYAYHSSDTQIIHLEWDEALLAKFLAARVRFARASNDRVDSLSYSNLLGRHVVDDPDRTLVQLARHHRAMGAPRALLELGQRLFLALAAHQTTDDKLIKQSRQDAWDEFRSQISASIQYYSYPQIIVSLSDKNSEAVLGTGFLYWYQSNWYVITCAHVLSQLKQANSLSFSETIQVRHFDGTVGELNNVSLAFPLQWPESNITAWKAEEDVAILKLIDPPEKLKERQFFSSSLTETIDEHNLYSVFGYTRGQFHRGGLQVGLRLRAELGVGYRELIEDPNIPEAQRQAQRRLERGFSGAPVQNEYNQIVGMIDAKDVTRPGVVSMIPAKTINACLNKLDETLSGQ